MYMGERWLGEAETEWGLAPPYAIAPGGPLPYQGSALPLSYRSRIVSSDGSPFTEVGH
jgi:hypothetical protein